ncbi:hypothetical protein [Pseudovibrio sp. Alg231-02]|uniref:PD-(D/E)XK nuclease domain-containing protein n=1 Tax=Pseudovibrio sp. Alg231-02 TaxID=1922223 RepID=UPI0018FF51BB|nr:hypothetical protein [Pseudovibrio sp. Alg231-02]
MNKQPAITKLNEKIDTARKLTKSYQDDKFEAWQHTTKVLIKNVFPSSDSHIRRFESISYSPMVITTSSPSSIWAEARNDGLSQAINTLAAFVDEIVEFWEDIEPQSSTAIPIQASQDPIEMLIDGFHKFARQLRRRHNNRATIKINDEYDVQDALHALLKLFYKDIRNEEWTPSYAGGSARMDFLLKDEKIVIEVKKTRDTLKDKKIGEELLIDIARYKAHHDCNHLICFVYDPEELITNPTGLESDLSGVKDGLKVSVFIRPRH